MVHICRTFFVVLIGFVTDAIFFKNHLSCNLRGSWMGMVSGGSEEG